MNPKNPFLHKFLAKPFNIVFAGNMAAASLGALALWMVSRKLTVGEFGLFSLALTVIRTIPNVTTFGLDTTTIKFASSFLRDDETAKAVQVIRTLSSLRFFSAVVLAAVIFFAAGPISENIFHSTELTALLRMASLGVLCASQFNYLKAVFWSYQLFKKSVVVQLVADAGKVLATLFCLAAGVLTPAAAVAVFSLSPLPGIFLANIHMPHKAHPKERSTARLGLELFSFTKWVFCSELCRAMFSSIGLFIVTHRLGTQAAGIYGLASNLTYVFPILLVSLKAVLMPSVSRFHTKAQYEQHVRKTLETFLTAFVLLVPLLLFSRPLILFFFGARYAASAPVFNVLFLAYLVHTLQQPFYAVLYALHKPSVLAGVDFLRLLCVAFGTYALIPILGLQAAALVFLAANLGAVSFLIPYTRRLIRTAES